MSTGNILSGMGTGAATGASLGSVAGPWGAVIGGAIGGVAGGLTSMQDDKEKRYAQARLNKELKSQYDQGIITLDQYNQALQEANKDYINALDTADFDSASKIDFNKDSYNRDDYRKSNEESIKQGVANTAMAQNIGSGSSWGSGAQGNILDAVVKQQEELDAYADQKMNEQRNFDYNLASTEASQRLNALQQKLNALGQKASLNTQMTDAKYGGILSLQNTQNQNKIGSILSST